MKSTAARFFGVLHLECPETRDMIVSRKKKKKRSFFQLFNWAKKKNGDYYHYLWPSPVILEGNISSWYMSDKLALG